MLNDFRGVLVISEKYKSTMKESYTPTVILNSKIQCLNQATVYFALAYIDSYSGKIKLNFFFLRFAEGKEETWEEAKRDLTNVDFIKTLIVSYNFFV